jgi:branched-chain amino acid transport system permease protein
MSTTDGPTLMPDSESAKDRVDRFTAGTKKPRLTQAFRDKWNNLRRPQQWAFLLIVVVLRVANSQPADHHLRAGK